MRDDDLQTAIIYLLSCDLYLAEKPLALAPLSLKNKHLLMMLPSNLVCFYNVLNCCNFEMLYRFCSLLLGSLFQRSKHNNIIQVAVVE